MRPSEILPQHRETIRQLVLQAGMANPRVFGSVVRGEDREDSDLDLLVDPAPRASLLAMEKLQAQLEKATGVKIDLRTPEEINQRFRGKVLAEAAPEDIPIRVEVFNRGPEAATLHVLPTVWFRNRWSWGYNEKRPDLRRG